MPNSKSIGTAYSDPALSGGTLDDTVIGGTTPVAVNGTLGTFTSFKTIGSNLIASTSASTLGFFLSAGVAQVALSAFAAVATTAAIPTSISSSAFGYTSAQATNIILLVNALRAMAVSYGLGAT